VERVVAALQLSSQADVAKNLDTVARLTMLARKRGAELVVLPENFALMGESDEARRDIAEAIDDGSAITGFLASLAKQESVAIVAGGFPELSEDPHRPYNTSLYIDANGAFLASYRKIHLFDVSLADGTELKESRTSLAGDRACVVRDGELTVGMTICYDLRFPELYQVLTDASAHLITVPAAFTLTTGKDHWHALLRARAIENQVFVVAAAQHGRHPRGRQTYGKSLIVDPWGDILAQAPEGEGMALAALDFAHQTSVRKQLPCLSHQRPFANPS
jgi:deaminated glutathione amidase